MTEEIVSSDVAILDLLRKRDTLTVPELAEAMQVTATAVRQRLSRLMAHGYLQRTTTKAGRGRPSHHYALTTLGRRKTGANFADLAVALWQEIREIQDPDVRKGLLQRVSRRLAVFYRNRVTGESLEQKMESLVELFDERKVPFTVDRSKSLGQLPVLTALACPYPDLAEQDRSVCGLERMLFSDLLGEEMRLTKCRLDGENCCTFEPAMN